MSRVMVSVGSARRSFHDQVFAVSTDPLTPRAQSSVRTAGVSSADSTGQLSPTSY